MGRPMRILLAGLIAANLLTAASGCANFTTPIAPVKQMTVGERNFEAVWGATRRVLRKYYFELDREDRRAGIIVTEPMVGKHAGEFWRKDAATARDLAEGTIQTIYRQAKVTIRPTAADGDKFHATVEVRTYRSNRQDIQVTSTSEAIGMFRLPGDDERRKMLLDYGRGWASDPVSPLGRDGNLERRIAADIQAATPQVRAELPQ